MSLTDAPSFQRLLAEAKASIDLDDPVWRVNDKLSARTFATECGVRVVDLIDGPASLKRLRPPDVDRCVVKPRHGNGCKGVMPLVRHGRRWLSLHGDGLLDWPDVLRACRAQKRADNEWGAARDDRYGPLRGSRHPDRVRGPWFIEAMVPTADGDLPDDWSCFTFGGQVAVIRQRRLLNHRRRQVGRWWTPDWRPCDPVYLNRPNDDGLPPPRDPAALVAAAECLAASIPAPFVRIDLFEDRDGPLLGEITPHPGSATTAPLDPEWDRRLGTAWMEAACR